MGGQVERNIQNWGLGQSGKRMGPQEEQAANELRQAESVHPSVLQERHHQENRALKTTCLSVLRTVLVTTALIRCLWSRDLLPRRSAFGLVTVKSGHFCCREGDAIRYWSAHWLWYRSGGPLLPHNNMTYTIRNYHVTEAPDLPEPNPEGSNSILFVQNWPDPIACRSVNLHGIWKGLMFRYFIL